jgi:hypothetical protein
MHLICWQAHLPPLLVVCVKRGLIGVDQVSIWAPWLIFRVESTLEGDSCKYGLTNLLDHNPVILRSRVG